MSDSFRNRLYFGDNLKVLRGEFDVPDVPKIEDESVDLIYLDPPFNSQRNYNLLFKQQKGEPSPAQIMAFEDTWEFSHALFDEFKADERNAKLWPLVKALYDILGKSEMMAYVIMMAPRLLELHKKLKKTGSLYLHCDPVASHYLKIILDVVFQPQNVRNEVVWKRTTAKGLASKRLPRNHDILLNYAKDIDASRWNADSVFQPYDPNALDQKTDSKYTGRDPDGRRYQLTDLTNPNRDRPNLTYEFLGVTKVWRWTRERMQRAYDQGLVVQPRPGGVPRLKRYLDEQRGKPLDDVWADIPPINSQSKERRGYPTQKPLALLERIIAASSNPGDVVLDPFAGCGTAIVAAERMDRKWIGIDITYLAINEILDRLHTEHKAEKPPVYDLYGAPKDFHSAQKLFEQTEKQNHKPFEQWACTLVGARWNEKKGADRGIDGRIGIWLERDEYREVLVQVKGGSLTLSQVRDFANVIQSNKAVLGILLTMREPTKEMKLVADEMGLVEYPGSRKIPRYQILFVGDVLEKAVRAEIPEGYAPRKYKGVGRAMPKDQSLFESTDQSDEEDAE